MEQTINNVFADGSYVMLTGLIAAALFFARTGLQELGDNVLEGVLYVALAIFFVCLHMFCLLNVAESSPLAAAISGLTFWEWSLLFLAPSVIVLFSMLGLWSSFAEHFRKGLVKLFFGLTLLCYLYLLGADWPADSRAILTLCYCGVWFNLELRRA